MPTQKETDDILELARKRFDEAVSAESNNRGRAVEDLRFAYGDQWPEDVKKRRKDAKLPCLTINKIPKFTRKVINDIRQTRPAIKVRPVDSQADPDTAEILGGMIKAIEQDSGAETAYDWASQYAVDMGWGYFKIVAEWDSDGAFEQIIKVKRINNPFSVYPDPHCKEHDNSDMEWCFEIEDYSKEAFEAKWPDAEGEWQDEGSGTHKTLWFGDNTVQVASYWTVEKTERQVSMVPDGVGGYSLAPGKPEGAVSTRNMIERKVTQRIITGKEILEENEVLGKYIGIVPVKGEEVNIEGEMVLRGMVNDLKDPQMQYNFVRTASVESWGPHTKAPWIGPKGSFTDRKWKSANTVNYAYMEFTPVNDKKGNPLPPPQRTPQAQVSPALTQDMQISSEEMNDVSGIFAPGLGDVSPDVSQRAFRDRKTQSDVANFHYVDNLARSMRHAGRIMVDLIPKIYTGERMVRILRPNGDEESVQINKPYADKQQKNRFYNIQAGRYDASVDVGPSYTTQRQEAVENMLEIAKSFPQAVNVMGDLIAKNMDWPDADEFAKRLKLLLPPEIASEENPQVKQIIQQSEQQMQRMQQYVQYLEQQVKEKELKIENKSQEIDIKWAELQRKAEETVNKFQADLTEMELKYGESVPGALV